MNKGLTFTLGLVLGAAAGSVAAWMTLKTKYERIANEEIESVKFIYAKKAADAVESYKNSVEEKKEPKDEYTTTVSNLGYTVEPKKGVEEVKDPYVISPDEFGSEDDYDLISYTYYSDGVLTDERDEPVEDVDDVVGKDFYKHFGEYEDDSVFIRNEQLECDFEILYDTRSFGDDVSNVPRSMEE